MCNNLYGVHHESDEFTVEDVGTENSRMQKRRHIARAHTTSELNVLRSEISVCWRCIGQGAD